MFVTPMQQMAFGSQIKTSQNQNSVSFGYKRSPDDFVIKYGAFARDDLKRVLNRTTGGIFSIIGASVLGFLDCIQLSASQKFDSDAIILTAATAALAVIGSLCLVFRKHIPEITSVP